ncbi:flagellar basal body-associated protein FliL [Salipiger sp. PrR003]|uniref:flagellar basal body-associated FliL family protein n=1 Tax=Salipiger sp. PrR003 TaxID=2706776 RepID=UPI0013DD6C75|nr:flagellar basal body-associated FliL family protein [Salipiger sp. PrR003]NDV50799.1 flagellar motor switch protein M [Salipiger sp. PrR003]
MSAEDTNIPDTDGTGEELGAAAKKGASKIVKIVALLLIGSFSLAGGLFLSVGKDGVMSALSGSSEEEQTEHAATDEHRADESHEAAGEGQKYSYLNFDEMIVNITGYTAAGRKTSRFMKIKFTMVYEDHGAEAAAELESRKLYMRDAFQDYLRQLDERDLQGSFGLVRLRSELLKRAKAVAGNDAPHEILIGDLIIQ